MTIETSGAERFRIDSLGRVGLGVTNQILRLQVAAQSSSSSTAIAATDTDYLATFRSSQLFYIPVDATGTTLGVSNSNLGGLQFLNNTNTVIGVNTNTPLIFATNSTERMRITGAGNVGIGMTGPTEKLDVSGNINTTLATYNFVNVNSGTVQAQFAANGSGSIVQIRAVSDHPMGFHTNNLERMRITATGNVGIGKTNPTVALDVVGGITSTASIVTSGTNFLMTGQSTSDQSIKVGQARTGSGNSYIDLIGDTTYTGFGTRLIRGNTGENANSTLQHRGTGALSLYAQDAGIVSFFTSNTERMRIDSSGNVGIGTASPSAGGGGTILNVKGASAASFRLNNNTDGLDLLIVGGAGYIQTATAIPMLFRTNSTERMRILSGGNVGIGTSSPATRLHVSGTTTLDGGYTEKVFAITDGATVNLDPNNGSIQTWTLGAGRTPGQENWAAGQSITLMIDDGTANTITWTTLAPVWETNGGVAPTLATSGFTVIVLWKVATTIYGARVGDA